MFKIRIKFCLPTNSKKISTISIIFTIRSTIKASKLHSINYTKWSSSNLIEIMWVLIKITAKAYWKPLYHLTALFPWGFLEHIIALLVALPIQKENFLLNFNLLKERTIILMRKEYFLKLLKSKDKWKNLRPIITCILSIWEKVNILFIWE